MSAALEIDEGKDLELMPSRKVIVNADDFGWSQGVSEGILQAHRQGVVTSTTLVANMPNAEWAVGAARMAPELGVGVHLNACQGPPLSRAGERLANRQGIMNHSAVGIFKACMLNSRLVEVIGAEFEAQIGWVLDHGLCPTHLDSHRHLHAFPPVFARTVALAEKYHVPFIRWPRERLPRSGWLRPPPRQAGIARLLNGMCLIDRTLVATSHVGTLGTWGIAHTGRIGVEWLVRAAATLPEGVTEIMTHPGRADGLEPSATRLLESREAEMAALCSPAVKEAFAAHHVELIHYGHLAQQPTATAR